MIFSLRRLRERENLCHFPPSKRHWHAMMLYPIIWCGTTTTQNSKHNHHHRAMMMTTMILFEMGRRNETLCEIFINPRHLAITQRSESSSRDNENINFDKILNSILPYPSLHLSSHSPGLRFCASFISLLSVIFFLFHFVLCSPPTRQFFFFRHPHLHTNKTRRKKIYSK